MNGSRKKKRVKGEVAVAVAPMRSSELGAVGRRRKEEEEEEEVGEGRRRPTSLFREG